MKKKTQKIIIEKLLSNINAQGKNGMVIASPSDNPPYRFHWVRDASIVMRVIIDLYRKDKSGKYFKMLLDYIENCDRVQTMNTLTGLGEPKVNTDGTPYNEPWGRPQNDGPALRGLNMITLYKLFCKDYKNIADKLILPILQKDLTYIIENYDNPCFDLWEEIVGWHFYTRVLQLKFLKEMSNSNKLFKDKLNIPENLDKIFVHLQNNLLHHRSNDSIISSFDKEGNVIRVDDASVLLAICHIDFDQSIIKLFGHERFLKVCNNLENYFKQKYNDESLCLVGRYPNDAYYDGQTWIICSLAIAQTYFFFNYINNYEYLYFLGKNILNKILSLTKDLDMAEQYNPNTNEFLSAKTLTWNYAELYFTTI